MKKFKQRMQNSRSMKKDLGRVERPRLDGKAGRRRFQESKEDSKSNRLEIKTKSIIDLVLAESP